MSCRDDFCTAHDVAWSEESMVRNGPYNIPIWVFLLVIEMVEINSIICCLWNCFCRPPTTPLHWASSAKQSRRICLSLSKLKLRHLCEPSFQTALNLTALQWCMWCWKVGSWSPATGPLKGIITVNGSANFYWQFCHFVGKSRPVSLHVCHVAGEVNDALVLFRVKTFRLRLALFDLWLFRKGTGCHAKVIQISAVSKQ